MAHNDLRSTALANCKALYGPDTEVLTLSYGGTYDKRWQAIAVRFDPDTASWTKVLHGEEQDGLYSDGLLAAIMSLLSKAQHELGKLFSETGIDLPFVGDHVMKISLPVLDPPKSSASKSVMSDDSSYEFIATPATSSSPGEVASNKTIVDVKDIGEAPAETRPRGKSDGSNFEFLATPAASSSSGDVASLDATLDEPTVTEPTLTEPTTAESTIAEPQTEIPAPTSESQPQETNTTSVASAQLEQPAIEEARVNEVQAQALEAPSIPDSEILPFFRMKCKKCKQYKKPQAFTGFSKTKLQKCDKCKKSMKVEQPTLDLDHNPEPEPSVSKKKDLKKNKKKKGKCVVEECPPTEELPLVPEPEPDFDTWPLLPRNKNKGKGKQLEAKVEALPAVADPEPVMKSLWGFSSPVIKDNKSKEKRVVAEEPLEVIESQEIYVPESYIAKAEEISEDIPEEGEVEKIESPSTHTIINFTQPEAGRCTPQGKYNVLDKVLSIKEQRPRPGVLDWMMGPSWKTKLEIEDHEQVDENLPKFEEKAIVSPQGFRVPSPHHSTATSVGIIQTQHVQLHGQTVVLNIEYTNGKGNQNYFAMVNLAEDTKCAIFDAANRYLDSTRIPAGLLSSSRKLKIKYGAGKTGNIDVSSLEDSLWPQYLEYLSQYTKFPELTIEVQDREEFGKRDESSDELMDD